MRFYQLWFDNQIFLQQDKLNPCGLRVTFDLIQYDGAEMQGQFITVYGLPPEFYKSQATLKDKKIQLYAGFLESPILKKIGVKPSLNNLLVSGYILNTFGNWLDNEFTFSISASPINPSKTAGGLLQMKKGDSVKQKLGDALLQLYPKALVSIGGKEVQAVDSIEETIYSSYDLKTVGKNYSVDIYADNIGFYITDTQQVSNYPSIRIKQNEIVGNITYLQDTSTIKLDLLLRGDLRLGRKINIEPKLYATATKGSSTVVSSPKAFVQGEFIITKIWHKGDSTNPSYSSWITSIEAVVPNKTVKG